MYVNLLRLLGSVCVLTTFWSGVRVADISVFEWAALLFIGAGALYRPPTVRELGLAPFRLAFAGLAVMALGGIVSAPGSFEMMESLTKAAKLVAAFMLTMGVGYVALTRNLFTLTQMLRLLAISAAICSVVAILQGQAGMFLQFVPRVLYGEGGGGRMTGLAEHPIEMGLVSAYGVAAALGLAIQTRKWALPALMMAVDAYSTRFSASLTAVFALILCVTVICVYTRQYKALLAGGVIAALVTSLVLAGGGKGSALLIDRINLLFASGGNYTTVQSREAQLGYVLQNVSPATILVGNGYSEADLPYKMEIHNGILASVYHFGVLGLAAQFLVIGFIISPMRSAAPREEKSALFGCILIFSLAYLSGPPQARPSLWAPPLFLAALLSSPRKKAESLSSGVMFGQLHDPIQPHP